MVRHDSSVQRNQLLRNEKKGSKQKRRLQERLERAFAARTRAEARLKRAEEKLQLKAARVQRLEQRLQKFQQAPVQNVSVQPQSQPLEEILDLSFSPTDNRSYTVPVLHSEDDLPIHWDVGVFAEPSDAPVAEHVFSVALSEDVLETLEDIDELSFNARTVAEVAEEAARITVERAHYAQLRLEQSSVGRHLVHEYEQMQIDLEKAQFFADETARVFELTEQLITSLVPEQEASSSVQEEVNSVQQRYVEDEMEDVLLFDTPEEDEAAVAAVASLIIADAMADDTAESQSLRCQTHDVLELVRQAEYMLMLVHSAVEEGTLVGEDAVRALAAAEQEVMHARSLLQSAERKHGLFRENS